MNREDIERLLIEARSTIHHQDYVIIGSLSVLGAVAAPPVSMTGSIDIDLYPKNDPGRASEVAAALGLGSEFERILCGCGFPHASHAPTRLGSPAS